MKSMFWTNEKLSLMVAWSSSVSISCFKSVVSLKCIRNPLYGMLLSQDLNSGKPGHLDKGLIWTRKEGDDDKRHFFQIVCCSFLREVVNKTLRFYSHADRKGGQGGEVSPASPDCEGSYKKIKHYEVKLTVSKCENLTNFFNEIWLYDREGCG